MLYACCTAPAAADDEAKAKAKAPSSASSATTPAAPTSGYEPRAPGSAEVTTITSGQFYANPRTPMWEEGGWPAEPNVQALDAQACAELWKLSAEMAGVCEDK